MDNQARSLWISIGAGVFAAFLMYSYSQEKKSEYDRSFGAQVNVVVAKKDILELQPIDDDMVEIAQRPSTYVEPGAVSNPETIIGHVAVAPIKKGEQILSTKLYQPGPDTGISLQVAPSKRALSLPVDEVRGVAKLIQPGDRIDILTAVDSGKAMNSKREVVTLLNDVTVLATGVRVINNIPRSIELDPNSKAVTQISLSGDTKYSSITVEVTPKDAQDLIYILSTSPGNIFFTLRNQADRQNFQRLPSSTSDSVLSRALGGGGGSSVGSIEAPSIAPPLAAPTGSPLLSRPNMNLGNSGRNNRGR